MAKVSTFSAPTLEAIEARSLIEAAMRMTPLPAGAFGDAAGAGETRRNGRAARATRVGKDFGVEAGIETFMETSYSGTALCGPSETITRSVSL